MKNKLFWSFLLLLIFANSVQATECIVRDAKVTQVHQYKDGHIFIEFDKATDCECQFPLRLAFHKNDDEKFFMSASLTALTSGKRVWAVGEDSNCPVHGNTAKLTNFYIFAN